MVAGEGMLTRDEGETAEFEEAGFICFATHILPPKLLEHSKHGGGSLRRRLA